MLYVDSLKKLYSILEKIAFEIKVDVSNFDNFDFSIDIFQKKIR